MNYITAGAVGLILASSCVAGSVGSGPVLAHVDGQPVRESELSAYVTAVCPEKTAMAEADAQLKRAVLEDYLDLRVLAAKARRNGLADKQPFIEARQLLEQKLLAQRWAERDPTGPARGVAITEEELRTWYRQRTNTFVLPAGFRARHLLVYTRGNPAFPDRGWPVAEARQQVEQARIRLAAGETWEAVAASVSEESGTRERGGLIRNGRFGQHPPEVETALRRLDPGQLSDPIQSQFGFHLVRLEQRTGPGERQPFEQVRDLVFQQLLGEKTAAAKEARLAPLRQELGFHQFEAAKTGANLVNPGEVAPDAVQARINGVPVLESEFQWFLRDAYRPEQRMSAYNRAGARRELLCGFLELRLCAAKARKEGLDREPGFVALREIREMQLLAEFLQERDRMTPWQLASAGLDDTNAALKSYLTALRGEFEAAIEPLAPK